MSIWSANLDVERNGLMRPCTCDNVTGAHYTPEQCRRCWKWRYDPAYRAHHQPLSAQGRCIHLGAVTGESRPCSTCAGSTRIKTFTCDIYGQCTLQKPLHGVACCSGGGCPSYQPFSTEVARKRQQEEKAMRPCTCDNVIGVVYTPEQCRRCWKWCYDSRYRAAHEGRLLRINHAANGLGDALLGLVAVAGLRQQVRDKYIVYRVKPWAKPFVRLFDAAFDELEEHDPKESEASDRQLNPGYAGECESHCKEPRWLRYCRNIACEAPLLPPLTNRQRLAEMGASYRDSICLAPFSSHHDREWPLMHWLSLERLLADAGYRVLILDGEEKRCSPFRSEKIIERDAEKIVSIVLNSGCLIGNDSGLAHLSGILGRPTIVLCGPTNGEGIFGFYPDVSYIVGHLACNGCWWQPPRGDACQPHCPSLATITPREVLSTLDRLTQRLLIAGLYPNRSLLSPDKLHVLNRCVRACRRLPGDMAEFGVYRGGSAKLIAQACPEKLLHLFDPFCGIPEDDSAAEGRHRRGDFAADEEDVRAYLAGSSIAFHVGLFSQTAPNVDDVYSFVHFDGDTYQSAKAALDYFWPRLADGGILVVDDWHWHHTPGVEKAVQEAGLSHLVETETPFQGILRKPSKARIS